MERHVKVGQDAEDQEISWNDFLEECTQAEEKVKALSQKLKRQRWVKQKLLGKAGGAAKRASNELA